jgi:hypothetical protein
MQPVPSEEFLQPEPRRWPLVIGILGLLWGVVGLVSGIFAVASLAMGEQPGVPPEFRGPVGVANSVAGLLVGALLCAGCVQLLRSKASGVRLLRLWVPLSVLTGVLGLAFMIRHRESLERAALEGMQAQMDKQAEQTGGKRVEVPKAMISGLVTFQIGCGGVLAAVPPLVMAIFVFGRRGGEALTEWSAAPQAS